VLLQDVRDGAASDRVPQIGQLPEYPSISPIPTFRCQPHNQGLDLTESLGATGAPFVAAIVLLSVQPSIAIVKAFSGETMVAISRSTRRPSPFALAARTSTLIVVQPQASVAQLLAEYSVFLPQVIDRVPRLLTKPSGDRNQPHPERIEGRAHCDRISAKTRG